MIKEQTTMEKSTAHFRYTVPFTGFKESIILDLVSY